MNIKSLNDEINEILKITPFIYAELKIEDLSRGLTSEEQKDRLKKICNTFIFNIRISELHHLPSIERRTDFENLENYLKDKIIEQIKEMRDYLNIFIDRIKQSKQQEKK